MSDARRIRRWGTCMVSSMLLACNSDSGSVRNWTCFAGSECECHVDSPGTTVSSSETHVSACPSYDCCLLTERGNDSACECFDTDAACDAVSASQPGSQVVTRCPPEAETARAACAAEGLACNDEYLLDNGYADCCEGLLCGLDDNGLRTCQTGTADKVSQYQQCKEDNLKDAVPQVTAGADLLDLEVGAEVEVYPVFGPGGRCDAGVSLSFASGCRIEAGPERNADGSWVITGIARTCPSFVPISELRYDGVQCTLGGFFLDWFCASGTWEVDSAEGTLRVEGTGCELAISREPSCPG